MNILFQSLGYTGITPIESHKYISVAKNEPDNINSRANITDGVASFYTNFIDTVKKLLVDIEMQQSGSGDPSPDNVRPISGWTGVTVVRAGENLISTNPVIVHSLVPSAGGTFNASANYNLYCFPLKSGVDVSFWAKNGAAGYITSTDTAEIIPSTPHSGRVAITQGTYPITRSYSGKWLVVAVTDESALADISARYSADEAYYDRKDSAIFPISWESEAGTVYGGTLDVTDVAAVNAAMAAPIEHMM